MCGSFRIKVKSVYDWKLLSTIVMLNLLMYHKRLQFPKFSGSENIYVLMLIIILVLSASEMKLKEWFVPIRPQDLCCCKIRT
ncbi:hypothetical protein AgCh_016141 [Apium graveolens]